VASILFYAWGGVSYTIILLASILINYITGLLLKKHGNQKRAKIILGIGIALNLAILIVFKYANFLVDNINLLIEGIGIGPIQFHEIKLPIGISFFTFQAISYIVDIYRKEGEAQKSFINIGLYISLFPQLIAGPIVRYHDIAKQLNERTSNLKRFASGVERFILGLAKKVLIANTVALVADDIFSLSAQQLSTPLAWLGIVAYSLQIYFDFSGYSDMAIGLGRMFGFEILENFNFPYISRSIKEFWRRWHISLSTWFRDYLYIPLGGNRVSRQRVYLNLFIVFFLTGFWHGAAWNFVVWGLFHGFFLVIERVGFGKILDRIWSPLQHIYVLFTVMIAWVFFRATDIAYAWVFLKSMAGLNDHSARLEDFIKFFNNELILVLAIGILGSAGLFTGFQNVHQKITKNSGAKYLNTSNSVLSILKTIGLLLMFILSISSLASGTYNPFIYFRF
jgi:alginate O-acetyltransferase complex protein AlgI